MALPILYYFVDLSSSGFYSVNTCFYLTSTTVLPLGLNSRGVNSLPNTVAPALSGVGKGLRSVNNSDKMPGREC